MAAKMRQKLWAMFSRLAQMPLKRLQELVSKLLVQLLQFSNRKSLLHRVSAKLYKKPADKSNRELKTSTNNLKSQQHLPKHMENSQLKNSQHSYRLLLDV